MSANANNINTDNIVNNDTLTTRIFNADIIYNTNQIVADNISTNNIIINDKSIKIEDFFF